MKAMILAAGLGTRLRPFTDFKPKAMVEVNGRPIIEHIILSLKRQGFHQLVVNVHHFGHQIKDFLSKNDFGVEVSVSDETDLLLDTGGGIVKAADLLFKKNSEPVLIHNVDILSNADLASLILRVPTDGSALYISRRDSSRKLVFDSAMTLCGWHDLKDDKYLPENFVPRDGMEEFAFSGIYAMSEGAVREMASLIESNKFSVIEYFLNPHRRGDVRGVAEENLKVLDVGKPASLTQAQAFLSSLNSDSN